jgi:prepilin-type processing-associated H-X9-DG protein
MTASRQRLNAFTLVELLVVIGIIAALIGILLPVLSGVQARGRDLKCQSNIRQLLQAVHGYAAEHKGSMPYGLYDDPHHPVTWQPTGGDGRFVSWASLVGRYMVRRASGDNEENNFPPVMQCPEALQAWNHVLGYAGHMVVFPAPIYEYNVRGADPKIPAWDKPPISSGLFPYTAMIWDTAVGPGLDNNVGYIVSGDLDDQRIWGGAKNPQWRFFDARDPYGASPNPAFRANGNNAPIKMGTNFRNIDPDDPDGSGPGYPYQGNLRFRHNKGTACNVGFSDGHVEAFTAKINPDRSIARHDALRKHFLLKWPSGMPRNTATP